MSYKFEKLEIWNLALEYIDKIYKMVQELPPIEQYNLSSQILRSSTSVALNIAEGSTGQSDAEQNRFIGMAIRSLIESVGCLHHIKRRKYISEDLFMELYNFSEKLFAKLQAFRRALGGKNR